MIAFILTWRSKIWQWSATPSLTEGCDAYQRLRLRRLPKVASASLTEGCYWVSKIIRANDACRIHLPGDHTQSYLDLVALIQETTGC